MAFRVTSSAFQPGNTIPAQFTCTGENASPDLEWSGVPDGTQSFALIVEDPDAPSGTFTHWVLVNIPAETHELPKGVPSSETVLGRAHQGRNDFGRVGYGGPCPPPGKPHRYFFRLFALDTMLKLSGSSKHEIERAMQGHILAKAELMGRFER